MIDYILNKIDHFLHKDRYLDTYIQNIISEKTGFKANKIKLLKDLLNQIDKTSRGFPTENILLQAKPYKLWRKRYVPAMIINISYRLRSYFRK